MKALLAQTVMELRLTSRRGENLLVTLVIPLLLLLFFASINLFSSVAGQRPVDFLVPGLLAMAIMSTGMVSLGIATAYERHYGVLKRLGGSPLTRSQLVGAKTISIVVIEVIQVLLLAGIAALAYDWRPAGGLWLALGIALLGTVTFAGLGLLMAGALRAEATLALANGFYLGFVLIGGIFLPVDHLPEQIAVVAPYLPATALADLLRASLAGFGLPLVSLLVLVGWTAFAVVLTSKTFQWE